ncbi:MAG TPA: hypothetical protein PKL77_09495 [Candidatus Omnitrophota bacterium]|jgi:hypothetical protein|nr:hypothetical protein [Candidatus Omnitrophota bacterium]
MAVKLQNNSSGVVIHMGQNALAALTAMGAKAQEVILDNMQSGYGKPIRITGDLMRDVHYDAKPDEELVRVGNSLEYAPYVHEGTTRMKARHYVTDAINARMNEIKSEGMNQLKNGF